MSRRSWKSSSATSNPALKEREAPLAVVALAGSVESKGLLAHKESAVIAARKANVVLPALEAQQERPENAGHKEGVERRAREAPLDHREKEVNKAPAARKGSVAQLVRKANHGTGNRCSCLLTPTLTSLQRHATILSVTS